jgi:hypothetical protein
VDRPPHKHGNWLRGQEPRLGDAHGRLAE